MSTPLSSTDPAALAAASKCFCAIPAQQQALRSFLLANISQKATNPTCTTPSAPTGVSASNARVADPSTQMNVRWLQPANSGSFITGYVIKWGTVSGTYTNSMNVPLTPHNFTVTGLTPGTTYFFVVQSFAFSGCVSANSNEASNSTSGSPAVCAFAAAWAARVVANGGAAPSAATQTAICTFQNGLVADGLDTLMIAWSAIVPDNLIAAITPQLVGPGGVGGGLDPWLNIGPFVGADLTVNGLIGDGVAKCLRTDLRPNTIYSSDIDCGITLYAFTNLNAANCDIGVSDGANDNAVQLFGGTTFFDCWNPTAGAGRISAANAGFTGYVSCNRTAANAFAVYEANSGTPHNTLVSGATTGGIRTSAVNGFSVFALNTPPNNSSFSNKRLSFVAFHHGLTSAQSALFFNRIQTLRTALGGGFI